jgi:hypothetical protein
MRKHNRFYSDIPIERKHARSACNGTETLHDISVDGLCFSSSRYFNVGKELTLEIAVFSPPLRVKARVIWCHRKGLQYDTGVQFTSVEQGSCLRTVEFLQFLDKYKRSLFMSEGKRLTCEEAYTEFLERNASQQFLH